jgi:nucleotide-binding universal stress UspA family protein
MYKKVVAPLDGSRLAETALPHLEAIAKGCQIQEILLISVTEPVKGKVSGTRYIEQSSGAGHGLSSIQTGDVHSGLVISPDLLKMKDIPVYLGRMAKTAMNYLQKIGRQLEKKGFQVQVNVLIGNPAEEIVRFVEEQGAELIIMASRGTSGFNRWDMGNIAEKVIRATQVPVLLVKPEPGFVETKPRRKGVAN